MAGITMGTAVMKVVHRDDNVWDYSCCIVDLIWHMAQAKAKPEGEAPAAATEIWCIVHGRIAPCHQLLPAYFASQEGSLASRSDPDTNTEEKQIIRSSS